MLTRRVTVLIAGLLLLLLPAAAAAAPPANDDPANAATLGTFDFVVTDTTAATTTAGEPLTDKDTQNRGCSDGGAVADDGAQMVRTVWYRMTGDGTFVFLNAFDSDANFDTVLAVYEDKPAGEDELITCADDAGVDGNFISIKSRVAFQALQGHKYLIQAGGYITPRQGLVNRGSMWVWATNDFPANDDRAAAQDLTSSTGAVDADNVGGTEETREDVLCDADPDGPTLGSTVWFKYTAPAIGTATFTTTGMDTVMQVYEGNGTTTLTCNDDANPQSSGASQVSLGTKAGATYLIQVGGWEGYQGPFSIAASFVEDTDLDNDGSNRGQDCNDNDASVHPGAADPLGDGVDQNCDGVDGNAGDRDGDGSPSGQDCNDANPAVHPGAPDPRRDGVDQNCDGADGDALDRDGDGFRRPLDCRDNKPKIHPGAKDIPGDGIDQDCRGGDAKPKALPWNYGWFISPDGQVTKLTVKAKKGAKVTVVCRGGGCPGRISFKAKSGKRSLKGRFGRKLGAGATITIRAVKKGFKGREARIIYRGRNKQSTSRERCLKPGSTKKTTRC
jgi:hypothetical protein